MNLRKMNLNKKLKIKKNSKIAIVWIRKMIPFYQMKVCFIPQISYYIFLVNPYILPSKTKIEEIVYSLVDNEN